MRLAPRIVSEAQSHSVGRRDCRWMMERGAQEFRLKDCNLMCGILLSRLDGVKE